MWPQDSNSNHQAWWQMWLYREPWNQSAPPHVYVSKAAEKESRVCLHQIWSAKNPRLGGLSQCVWVSLEAPSHFPLEWKKKQIQTDKFYDLSSTFSLGVWQMLLISPLFFHHEFSCPQDSALWALRQYGGTPEFMLFIGCVCDGSFQFLGVFLMFSVRSVWFPCGPSCWPGFSSALVGVGVLGSGVDYYLTLVLVTQPTV